MVQDALVRAWRDLPGLREPDRFDAWLNRLLTNTAIDEARRRRRRVVEVELTPIDAPIPDPMHAFADRDEILRALGRLQAEQRAVIVLRYFLDLPINETAATLGVPTGTAKSRLNRAVAALRASVEADGRVTAAVARERGGA